MTTWDKFTSMKYPIFNVDGEPRSEEERLRRELRSRADKVLEEAAELSVAAKSLVDSYGTRGEKDARKAMLDEMADLTQALVNLKYALEVTDEELEHAAYDCYDRNRKRGRF